MDDGICPGCGAAVVQVRLGTHWSPVDVGPQEDGDVLVGPRLAARQVTRPDELEAWRAAGALLFRAHACGGR